MNAMTKEIWLSTGILVTTLALSLAALGSSRSEATAAPVVDAGFSTMKGLDKQVSPALKRSFEASVAALGAQEGTITVTPGIWPISEDLVVPSNITIKVERGAVISIASGKILTIKGTFEAGTYQVFSYIGSGEARFAPSAIKEAFPEWWGVHGKDDQVAINRAIRAVPKGSTIRLLNKSYILNGTVTIDKDGIYLQGSGWTLGSRDGSYLVWNGEAYPAIELGNAFTRDTKLEDFAIQGNHKATFGIKLSSNALFGTIRNLGVVGFTGANAAAVGQAASAGVFNWQIQKCRLVRNFNGIQLFRSNAMVLRDNVIVDNLNMGVTAELCYGLTISGGDIENNGVANIRLSGGSSITAENIYMEAGPPPHTGNHRSFLIQQHPSHKPISSLTIRGNYIVQHGDKIPDHFIEIEDNATHWLEISNNFFGTAKKELIKNGKGNFGRAVNNRVLRGTRRMFDDDSGWSHLGPERLDNR